MIFIFLKVGSKSLSDEEMSELSSLIFEMGEIYGSTKICLEWAPEECYYLGIQIHHHLDH